ncbi:hypothetical protein BH10PSE14_BH10PSE14_04670 [soil metagenome]
MGDRYPAYLPPAVAEILGMPPYELHPVWMAMREVGIAVPTRYEGELSAALHFLLPFAIEHGDDWRTHAVNELERLRDGGTFAPRVLTVEAIAR